MITNNKKIKRDDGTTTIKNNHKICRLSEMLVLL